MKKLIALSLLASSAALAGCACLGIGSSSSASKASAPAAVAANANASSQTTTIELDIKFDVAKDEILPLYDHQLQKVADFMRMHPESTADVEGYADVTGTTEYNQSLSQRRAVAVRNALIQRFSCDATRLTTIGYGERPLIGTGSVAERARNRRVSATFTGKKA